MQPKNIHENPDLFRLRLDQFIDMKHELVVLANKIDWSAFERKFGSYYVDKKGRPGAPIRLMVGLHYLKSAFNESDESAVYRFFENPYWFNMRKLLKVFLLPKICWQKIILFFEISYKTIRFA